MNMGDVDDEPEILEAPGPSVAATHPVAPFELREKHFAILDGRPFKIYEHGKIHFRFAGLDIFTNVEYEHYTPSTVFMEAPTNVSRKDYQLIDILDNGYASLSFSGRTRNDLKIPDGDLGAKIRNEFTNKTRMVFCTVLSCCAEEGIVDTRSIQHISKDYKLIDMSEQGYLILKDDFGDTREDVKIPGGDLGREIIDEFQNGEKDVICTVVSNDVTFVKMQIKQ